MDLKLNIAQAALQFPILLFSLCFHEWGHAWSAKKLGDLTAEREGRLTMNPVAHMDPIGTFLLPLGLLLMNANFLFGWAKPVPVVPVNLRKMKDIVWVALAGPACNLILMLVALFLFKAYLVFGAGNAAETTDQLVRSVFQGTIFINALLMWFNLIPLTPLDGSKVLLAYIPGHSRMLPFWQAYEQYGPFILLILLFTGGLWRILAYPFALTWNLVEFIL